ncbi:hypothetical protein NUSPORA_02434 [Nucleospora cyclopteri]
MISNKLKQTYTSKIAFFQTINVKNIEWTKKCIKKIGFQVLADIYKALKEYSIKT